MRNKCVIKCLENNPIVTNFASQKAEQFHLKMICFDAIYTLITQILHHWLLYEKNRFASYPSCHFSK